MDRKYFLAIDIGASSGRHILGSIDCGILKLEEIYRFKNGATIIDGSYYWDWKNLFSNIIEGLKVCKKINKIPYSVGIDTWGVDYALIDDNGQVIEGVYSYRDDRTLKSVDLVHELISDKDLYLRTGIQKQSYNSIYQLYDDKLTKKIDKASSFLLMPDFMNYLLTGVKMTEFSEASTTGLVNAKTSDWDYELIEKLGFNKSLFGKISTAGTVVGELTDEIKDLVGFNTKVVLVPSHDTASAIMSVPAEKDYVYISSGTWSLMGIVCDDAITNDIARESGFTNERGYAGKITFLQNIMGLWMIQCLKKELNDKYDFVQLVEEAKKYSDFPSVVEVNDQSFFAPKSMIEAIKEYCGKTNQKVPSEVGELAYCLYNSLAICYNKAIINLETITSKKYNSINIVGGGCQNKLLNELTAKHTGRKVVAGPVEGTAIGNFISQILAEGSLTSLSEAKEIIKKSFDITEIK